MQEIRDDIRTNIRFSSVVEAGVPGFIPGANLSALGVGLAAAYAAVSSSQAIEGYRRHRRDPAITPGIILRGSEKASLPRCGRRPLMTVGRWQSQISCSERTERILC